MGNIDDEIKSKFTNNRHRFVTNLVFTANWVLNASEAQLRPFGISNQQYNILRILRGAGDWMAMSVIKSRMIEKAPNATRLADKLLDKGLIERKRSKEDRRVVYVQITKAGLKLLEDVDKVDSVIMKSLDNISEKEAQMVSNILDKFRV